MSDTTTSTALVQAHDLAKTFDVSAPWLNRVLERKPKQMLNAVDGVSFEIARGQTLALVGESGCGKSTVAKLLVGLYNPTRGGFTFDGQDAHAAFKTPQGRQLRRRIQMIFQDPYASLNPRWSVEDIVGEPLREHRIVTDRDELRGRVDTLLEQVGLSPLDRIKFPHEFSGGQRQRISIARALASEPGVPGLR
jgi:peptide/nickel transport system ATP-binding protein